MSKHILELLETLNSPIAVFDLDSTLINVQPRNQQILNEFIEEFLDKPKSAQVLPADWGTLETLYREAPHLEPRLFNLAQNLWRDKFFSLEYLNYDRPMSDAVAFVQHLSDIGIKIIYLTGRNKNRLENPTRDQLEWFMFPNGELHMKSMASEPDPSFKSNWFSHFFIDKPNLRVPFFENEPSILSRVVAVSAGQVFPIWIDSTHSRAMKPDPQWTTLSGFKIGAF